MNVRYLAAAAVSAVVLAGCSAAVSDEARPQKTGGGGQSSDTGWFDDVDAAKPTPEPEPEPAPDPNGTYTSSCDYLLGDFTNNSETGYRFVADASLKNTGNIGTVDEVKAVWFLAGGDKLVRTKTVRSEAGDRRRVGFEVPVTQNEIDEHQALGYNARTCKVVVTSVDTFGSVQ